MADTAANAQPNAEYAAEAPTGSRFVWHDLMTTDVTKALEFYTALFGWERRPFDLGPAGTYDMLYAGEVGIGGMVPLDEGAGHPPHWIAYVSVPDVDEACRKAEGMGATTHVPPTDIPTVGRFAVVADPQGAVFSPFSSSTPEQPEPKTAPAGTFAWNELMTSDPEGAAAFYGALTGWTVQKMDMPTGTYHLYMRGDQYAAGMMQLPADAPAPPHWLPYVAVESADASAARIAELGGTVLVPPTDIQDWGRFAVALDPQGAAFAVLQYTQPM